MTADRIARCRLRRAVSTVDQGPLPRYCRYYGPRSSVHGVEGGGRVDTTQLLKGVLDLAVLAVVRDADGYGYDIVRRLRAAGLEDVGDASVYGTLRRLYQAGCLTSYVVPSDEGPHRKYYGINDTGRAQLVDGTKTWQSFARTMDHLVNAPGEEAA